MLWALIIFAALRYNVGWDYMSYVEAVNTPSTWNNAETSRHSFIWRELFRFAYFVKAPHLAIIIPNIATYIFVYISLKKLNLSKRRITDALFVYTTWSSLYLGSFSTLRQALAMSVGLLMFAFVQNRQFIKSILLYIFAICLHPSAVILIFVYPVYFIRSHISFSVLCISIATLVFSLFSLKNILIILSFLGDNYGIYLNWNDNIGGKVIFVYTFVFVYLLTIFSISKHLDDFKRQCYYYSILALSGNISIYICGLPSVINRSFLYFSMFLIFCLIGSINIFRYKNYLRFIASVILALYFFTYLYITRTGEGFASSGYVPYNTILF